MNTTLVIILLLGLVFYFFYISKENFNNTLDIISVKEIAQILKEIETLSNKNKMLPKDTMWQLKDIQRDAMLLISGLERNAPKPTLLFHLNRIINVIRILELEPIKINAEYLSKLTKAKTIASSLQLKYDVFGRPRPRPRPRK